MSRVRDPEFVSVNGTALPRGERHLYLPPGQQEIKIRFALPGTDELSAKLRFPVGAKKYYIVRFETFPHAPGRLFTDYSGGDPRGDIIGVPVWLAYNVIAQGVYEAKERGMAVAWTHITVFSADPSEGKVASAIVEGSLSNPQNKAREGKRGDR
jgi:hypothetical protein